MKWIHPFMMGEDFINNKKRYCLWLKDVSPKDFLASNFIKDRLKKISELRSKSPTKSVREQAAIPYLFTQIRQPETDYLAIPRVSSQKREYIPIGFLSKDIIAGDKLQYIATDSVYIFGLLTSSVHNSWMRVVAGRLKSDYSYTPAVYNNFVFPSASSSQINKICNTATEILEVRKLYKDNSLADLYDPLGMPPELRTAHKANDKAVLEAYGLKADTPESDIVAHLFKLYEEKVGEQSVASAKTAG